MRVVHRLVGLYAAIGVIWLALTGVLLQLSVPLRALGPHATAGRTDGAGLSDGGRGPAGELQWPARTS